MYDDRMFSHILVPRINWNGKHLGEQEMVYVDSDTKYPTRQQRHTSKHATLYVWRNERLALSSGVN